AAAAEAYRGRKRVPIQIAVKAGPLFHLRHVRITDARTGKPFPPSVLPSRAIKLAAGDPARAADIRAGRAALVDWFRGNGHPLAKATATKPIVFHDKQVMDVAIAIDPGPRAAFGKVQITGQSQVDPRVVRSHVYIEPGMLYSPRKLAEARQSILGGLPAISSVRIREAKTLDANGRLPIDVDVTDRKRHVVGFGARYSTLDGPDVKAYWQDRNVFGGGESLRFEGEAFLPPHTYSSFIDSLDSFGWSDLGGRFKASFVKPALAGTRNDLLLNALVEKNRTGGDRYGGYAVKRNLASAAIRHRFSDKSSVQIGLVGEKGETTDSLGTIDYRLIGVPASVTYDTTDNRLNPTRGIRVTASVAAYPTFFGSSVGLVETNAQGSTRHRRLGHRRVARCHSRQSPLLRRRRRLGARLSLSGPEPARHERPGDRRPQPVHGVVRGALAGDRHHRPGAVPRHGPGVPRGVSGLQRAAALRGGSRFPLLYRHRPHSCRCGLAAQPTSGRRRLRHLRR
ncbi:MAG: BamA/TamA family outer membrane protein, partial [Pseudolabrys sp.]